MRRSFANASRGVTSCSPHASSHPASRTRTPARRRRCGHFGRGAVDQALREGSAAPSATRRGRGRRARRAQPAPRRRRAMTSWSDELVVARATPSRPRLLVRGRQRQRREQLEVGTDAQHEVVRRRRLATQIFHAAELVQHAQRIQAVRAAGVGARWRVAVVVGGDRSAFRLPRRLGTTTDVSTRRAAPAASEAAPRRRRLQPREELDRALRLVFEQRTQRGGKRSERGVAARRAADTARRGVSAHLRGRTAISAVGWLREEEQSCGGAKGVAEQAASRRRHRGVASRFGECGAPVEAAARTAEEGEARLCSRAPHLFIRTSSGWAQLTCRALAETEHAALQFSGFSGPPPRPRCPSEGPPEYERDVAAADAGGRRITLSALEASARCAQESKLTADCRHAACPLLRLRTRGRARPRFRRARRSSRWCSTSRSSRTRWRRSRRSRSPSTARCSSAVRANTALLLLPGNWELLCPSRHPVRQVDYDAAVFNDDFESCLRGEMTISQMREAEASLLHDALGWAPARARQLLRPLPQEETVEFAAEARADRRLRPPEPRHHQRRRRRPRRPRCGARQHRPGLT